VFRYFGNGIGDCGSISGASAKPDVGSGWNGWWDRDKCCERVSNARCVESGGFNKEGTGADCYSDRFAPGPRRTYACEPSAGSDAGGKCGSDASAFAVDGRPARNSGAS